MDEPTRPTPAGRQQAVADSVELVQGELAKLRRTCAINLPAPRRGWVTTLVDIADDVIDVIGDVAAGR